MIKLEEKENHNIDKGSKDLRRFRLNEFNLFKFVVSYVWWVINGIEKKLKLTI